MLDNLVRLRSVDESNADRCSTKSKTLCTLPITLQGLPCDSDITSQWHLQECDGSEFCSCKMPVTLTKKDIKFTLLELSQTEKANYQTFVRLMTWSNSTLWDKLTDEIIEHIDHDFTKRHETFVDYTEVQGTGDQVQGGDADQVPEDEDLVDILSDLNKGIQSSEVQNAQTQQTNTTAVSMKFDGTDQDNGNIREFVDETIESADVDDDAEEEEEEKDEFEDNMFSNIDVDFEDITELERSMDQMSILELDSDTKDNVQTLLSSFGFSKFKVPPLLCRHPPPAVGRDDDIYITKQILDETLKKMGYLSDPTKGMNRILCGPDNKIGKNVLKLMETDPRYKAFLAEFPLLHLRKSKITILFSAYQDAGIVEILQYMRDDKQDDWKRLVSVQHIDIATRHVKRIALSLHIAFLVVFMKHLMPEEQEIFWNDMVTSQASVIADCWAERYEEFLKNGAKVNATFALHVDIMRHCDHVVAIAFAKRLGGPKGYDLVLAAVKDSLRFSFVNNATSYAPYCVQLLHQHFSAGHFHQCLKTTLFTTPFKDSNRNFACDTKRELDHLDAIKGFRSGSSITAVTSRMSLMDTLNEARNYREGDKKKQQDMDTLGWSVTEVDQDHIFPTVSLILRQGGLSLEENTTPCNVHATPHILLPPSILDDNSNGAGEYILHRYVVREKMFGTISSDLPAADTFTGPSELIGRAKRSKGITIKRTMKSRVQTAKTESQLKEENRQKEVAKEAQLIDRFSSFHNACPAIVKSDSTKPKVMKAVTMPKALKTLLEMCITDTNKEMASKVILQNLSHIPQNVSAKCTVCVIEFAGVKFKLGNIQSGKEYVDHCERVIKGVLKKFPKLDTLVICEEKYHFTPDDFKAITREQRKTKVGKSVDHLKLASDIINETRLKKEAITRTTQGKMPISTYLAQNLSKIQISHECQIILDSEFHLQRCNCIDTCSCESFATPLLMTVTDMDGKFVSKVKPLVSVRQRKGEAEMAVADWVIHLQEKMKPGDSLLSIITSADIDAVPIHLYAVSKFLNRIDNNFKNSVFVVLEKPRGAVDIYGITDMITLLENKFVDANIGVKVALGLCMGGNDYIPKLHQISHETVLTQIFSSPVLRNNLFVFAESGIVLNQMCFSELFRSIYCPKRYKSKNLSYQDVRALSIGKTEDKSFKGGYRTTDPRNWLPPESAMQKLRELVQLQIKYMETIGNHDAVNPNFLQYSVLQRNASGEIIYDFGLDSHFETFDQLPTPSPDILASNMSNQKQESKNKIKAYKRSEKRQIDSTPQKGLGRKRQLTSTPKSRKQ